MASIKTSIQLVDNMSPALRSMNKALNIVLNSFESMNSASRRGFDASSFATARQELAKTETILNDVENDIRNATENQNKFNRSIKSGVSSANSLKSSFMRIAGAIGGIMGVKQILSASDEFTNTNARLNMLTGGDSAKTDELQKLIYASAQRSRGSYQDTADSVGKMGIMAKDSFTSNTELVAFMEQVNKQFVIAGTSAEGQKSAMLQLTQAMASGVLRGEELNSVFEQAPTIIQAIAKYMSKPIGQIRDLAKEGQLTSEIVKNAMFYVAEETNNKFNDMPKTFAQITTMMKNDALMKFQPVLQKINELMNSEKFMTLFNNITNSLFKLSNVAISVFDKIGVVANWCYDNWSVLAPIIGAVTTAILLYKSAVVLATAKTWLLNIATGVKTLLDALSGGATMKQALAQVFLNNAILSCPIFWIITAIIILIGVIIAVCNWIAKTTGVCQNAFGIILGAMMWTMALSWNIVAGVINAIIQLLWSCFVEPWIAIIEFVINVFKGGFDGLGGMFKNLLGNIIAGFLRLAQVVTPIIDAIFGTKWTEKLENIKKDVVTWGKNENAITLNRENKLKLPRADYTDAFMLGAKWGDNVTNKVKGLFGKEETTDPKDEMANLLDGVYGNTGSTANNTAKLTDGMGDLADSIEYMVDVAEREAINRFTTAEIKVDWKNTNNISSGMDIDDVMTKFNENLTEILYSASEGVH